MKIRTEDELQDVIDNEMAWRKKELTAIKVNISSSRKFAKDTALRSGIALLYAHWEGAIKNIAHFYLVYVSNLRLPYNKLKPNFLAISIKHDLSMFETTGKTTLHEKIVISIMRKQSENSNIPTKDIIKTSSNLSSDVFIEIMASIGLDCANYETSYKLIDEVLLNMRNKIAHGERLDQELSLDEARYTEIHDVIFNLIEQFAIQVLNSAALKEYKISQ